MHYDIHGTRWKSGTRAELEKIARSPGSGDSWSPPPPRGRQIDQLAIGPDGCLVLLHLKEASKGNAPVYYLGLRIA